MSGDAGIFIAAKGPNVSEQVADRGKQGAVNGWDGLGTQLSWLYLIMQLYFPAA